MDPPRLGRRGNPRPKLQEPGLGDVVGSFENLRVVAPELLAYPVRQASAFARQFLRDARPRPQLDDGRINGIDPAEAVAVCPERVGEDAGVAAVVLGTGGREAVAEAIKLLRVDRIDRKAPVHQTLHHRAVRNLDRHRDVPGCAAPSSRDPFGHLGQPRPAVAERPLFPLGSALAHHADVMSLRRPIDPGEAGVLSYHTPSSVAVSLRTKILGRRDARQSLYWRSKAQTPHWASIAAPGRGTSPTQVLGGTGRNWLLPAQSPVLRSRAPGCPRRPSGWRTVGRGAACPRCGPEPGPSR